MIVDAKSQAQFTILWIDTGGIGVEILSVSELNRPSQKCRPCHFDLLEKSVCAYFSINLTFLVLSTLVEMTLLRRLYESFTKNNAGNSDPALFSGRIKFYTWVVYEKLTLIRMCPSGY